MAEVTFNKTNRIGDDVEVPVEEVALSYWNAEYDFEKPRTEAWGAGEIGNLERDAIAYVIEVFGGWIDPPDSNSWDVIFAAIFNARPGSDG